MKAPAGDCPKVIDEDYESNTVSRSATGAEVGYCPKEPYSLVHRAIAPRLSSVNSFSAKSKKPSPSMMTGGHQSRNRTGSNENEEGVGSELQLLPKAEYDIVARAAASGPLGSETWSAC